MLLCFFVLGSNSIHAPGVVGEIEKLRCTPFHKVGIACVSFVLGMKPSVVQYFGLSRINAL